MCIHNQQLYHYRKPLVFSNCYTLHLCLCHRSFLETMQTSEPQVPGISDHDRQIPGISDHDHKILLDIRRRAHRLDTAWNLCGMRVGWSSIIGLIPVYVWIISLSLV
jgi:hypothetical protein